jgi:hypothetical protein
MAYPFPLVVEVKAGVLNLLNELDLLLLPLRQLGQDLKAGCSSQSVCDQ